MCWYNHSACNLDLFFLYKTETYCRILLKKKKNSGHLGHILQFHIKNSNIKIVPNIAFTDFLLHSIILIKSYTLTTDCPFLDCPVLTLFASELFLLRNWLHGSGRSVCMLSAVCRLREFMCRRWQFWPPKVDFILWYTASALKSQQKLIMSSPSWNISTLIQCGSKLKVHQFKR